MNLTRQLRGKEVVAVLTNGHIVSIRLRDGGEINIKWVDDNGVTMKGKPMVENAGWRMRANPQEIVLGKALGVIGGNLQ